jgi:hypothetical protein
MARLFEVKSAEELLDAEFIAKWRDRRAIDPRARSALRSILGRFVAGSGPVKVAEFPADVREAVARLDEKDLIFVQDGQVRVAYPFSAAPTAFRVLSTDGRERYAVCAIDALGIPVLLGQPAVVHSRCHHCGEPLDLRVSPDGPVGDSDVMVWVGERGDLRQKAATSI